MVKSQEKKGQDTKLDRVARKNPLNLTFKQSTEGWWLLWGRGQFYTAGTVYTKALIWGQLLTCSPTEWECDFNFINERVMAQIEVT